jgi:hypothetical protein
MSDWIKTIVLFAIAAAIFYSIHFFNEKHQEKIDAECRLSPECVEEKARVESRYSNDLIRSPSGRTFFRSVECAEHCVSIKAGYRWAEKVGLTRSEGCDQSDVHERKGCLMYYKELIDDLHDPADVSDGA